MENVRVLVTYASRAGATVGIAERIAEVLGAEVGLSVNLRPVRENPSPDGYDAFVIGSAVYAGQWLPEAARFLRDRAIALSKNPVAAFSVSLGMRFPTAPNAHWGIAYALKAFNRAGIVAPLYAAIFAGALDFSKLSPQVVERMKRKDKTPEGDYRDWEAISDWAARIGRLFAKGPEYDHFHDELLPYLYGEPSHEHDDHDHPTDMHDVDSFVDEKQSRIGS